MKIFNVLFLVLIYSNLAGAAIDKSKPEQKEITLISAAGNQLARGLLGEMIDIDGTNFLITEENNKKLGERIYGSNRFSWISITSYDEEHGICYIAKGDLLNDLLCNLRDFLKEPNKSNKEYFNTDNLITLYDLLSDESGKLRGETGEIIEIDEYRREQLEELTKDILNIKDEEYPGLTEEIWKARGEYMIYLNKLEALVFAKGLSFFKKDKPIMINYDVFYHEICIDEIRFQIDLLNKINRRLINTRIDNLSYMPYINLILRRNQLEYDVKFDKLRESFLNSFKEFNTKDIIVTTDVLTHYTKLRGYVGRVYGNSDELNFEDLIKSELPFCFLLEWLSKNPELAENMIDRTKPESEKYKAIAVIGYLLVGQEYFFRDQTRERFTKRDGTWISKENFKAEMARLKDEVLQILNGLTDKKKIFCEALDGIIDFSKCDEKVRQNLKEAGLID